MEAYETEEYKGYTIKLYPDNDGESPREWCNLGTMVCFHNHYNLGDEHDYSVESLKERLQRGDVIFLPLYLYDHSGISISTQSFIGRAQHAEWDSGQVGYIYATKEAVRKEYSRKRINNALQDKVLSVLKGEVDTYDQFLRGDVFGYVIHDAIGDDIDSCWGFYGDKEVMDEAKSVVDYLVKGN